MSDPVPTTVLERPRQLLALAFALCGAWYLAWRLDGFGDGSPWLSGLLLTAEALSIGALLLQVALGWRLSVRPLTRPHKAPSVDVFVVAGDTPAELLGKALHCAAALEGPHTVWLLGNGQGDTAAQRAWAGKLGCRFVPSPGPGADTAARLNHALAQSQAELVAWVAGDQACRRDFLSRTVGHFDDPRTAFVQTASGMPGEGASGTAGAGAGSRWLEGCFSPSLLPTRSQQRGWDRWNATVLGGSGSVLRRSALLDVDGFAAGDAGSCLRTSARLHARGARSVWHDERLTFSLAPESKTTQAEARAAARQDGWRVWREEKLLSRPGLSPAQRLRYLGAALAPVAPARKAVFLIAPVLAAFGAGLPAAMLQPGFLADLALHLLPVLLLGAVLQAEISRGEAGWLQVQTHHLTRLGAPLQQLLLGANAGAVGVVGAWSGAPTLPPALQWALTAWCGLNAVLLGAALLAPSRVRGRDRIRQRFMVTLAAELAGPSGERVHGTVDDLSEAGLRFYGSLLPAMAQGQPVRGMLHLPDGPLAFTGDVRHLGAAPDAVHQPRSVGCRIEVDAAGRERLEAFLYGCNLQWHIQSHWQAPATPLGRWLPERPPALARRHWNGAQLRAHHLAQALPALSAASEPGGADDFILSHAPLPENQPLILDVFRRMSVPSRGVRLRRLRGDAVPESGAGMGALHLYRIEAAEMPEVPAHDASIVAPFMLVDDEPPAPPPVARPARPGHRMIDVEDADIIRQD